MFGRLLLIFCLYALAADEACARGGFGHSFVLNRPIQVSSNGAKKFPLKENYQRWSPSTSNPWSGNDSSSGGAAGSIGAVAPSPGAAGDATSSDPNHYCRWYAGEAVKQAKTAWATAACASLVSSAPFRWSLDYQGHFSQCQSLFGTGRNAAESRTRAVQLDGCVVR